uniref:Putative resolvase n=2 Tax=Myxococcus fulvus TaxID=33 RepID=B0YR25_MYXFU|nr:putative resolvase [Myxococcus fulvus]
MSRGKGARRKPARGKAKTSRGLKVQKSRHLDIQKSRHLDVQMGLFVGEPRARLPAALYLRVSSAEQTVENQREPLLRLAEARGWEPTLYVETVSGSGKKRRPVFERMMLDAKAGKVRAVAVTALDRLGRSLGTVVETLNILHAAGAVVVSIREGIDTTTPGPVQTLLLGLFAALGQVELQLNRERTQAGLERARKFGTKSGRPIGRPRLDAELLRKASLLVDGGETVRQAALTAGVSKTTLQNYRREELAKRAEAERQAHEDVARMARGVARNP